MPEDNALLTALRSFADSVRSKMSQVTTGEPEDQLRGPFETFMQQFGKELSLNIVPTGETKLAGRLGKPDYAIHVDSILTGYVELKAPGIGTNHKKFKGHNREQFKRFTAIPNLLYCDGNEFALYQSGELIRRVSVSEGNIADDGKKTLDESSIQSLHSLLVDFLNWSPLLPTGRGGRIDLKRFAAYLAPLCRFLRQDVTEALGDPESPLVNLAADWRNLLFPDASDDQFADAYAQTVTFALLLARSEGADPLTLDSAEKQLTAKHTLLSRALQVLTDPNALKEISAAVDLLMRVIGAVPPATLTGPEDPWLYFYEDFLAAYDPELRKNAGAYYTPVEVVRAQVRLIDDLLTNRLNKPMGFADKDVVTLDPAVGTGTYLLGIIQHALERVEQEQGKGAVPGKASDLARNLYGFEIMTGPFAVSELRVSRALLDAGASLPTHGTQIYLTDTLESPHTEAPVLPLYLKPISDQHRRALHVKERVSVIVCLGNPPYDRHEAAVAENRARTGGWVRWGDQGDGSDAILGDFVNPASDAGHGIHIKWLYNLYVYFWRWALWKVFEQVGSRGPGVVSFITASSYLFGDAFVGMREHMRRTCDEIWIIDLSGEGRAARKNENVFDIQTPVAIAVAVRYGQRASKRAAVVHYAAIEGSRIEKLSALSAITEMHQLDWADCPRKWHASFLPIRLGDFFKWPIIRDLFPWQHSGLMLKRTWPIGPSRELLDRRWRHLLSASDRSKAFRGSGDREISGHYGVRLMPEADTRPLEALPRNTPAPPIIPYSYRSFDRQYLIADNRLISRPRTELWAIHGSPERSKQLYLVSQLWQIIGTGPALTAAFNIPDFHYFKGSNGGRDIIPFFRSPDGSLVNVLEGLIPLLSRQYRRDLDAEDVVSYVYGILAHPTFTTRFSKELGSRELRVPLTKKASLFAETQKIGRHLLWLHTYGERFIPKGKRRGQIPRGSTRCTVPVPGTPDDYPEKFEYDAKTSTLHVGAGAFKPVSPDVYEFEVSGLKVVQSWLKYRMKKGAGRKSSPLDDIRPERWTSQFTTELLGLLWVLEATLAEYPKQAKLLEKVIAGPCFTADELPPVPDEYRKPPPAPHNNGENGDLFEEE